ncbi:MAG: ATP-dependent DNA helicase RecQ [Verrucomicrobiota bacterium]
MLDSTQRHQLLEQHFGFREFLEGQEHVIETILDGQDTLVIMPTGGGKSLCYQYPALALEGITVVVSPLIALMKDQVDALTDKKIPATFINSSLSQSEIDARTAGMQRGDYRLVYIAPERFKSDRFIRALAPLSIALFAVDEAHCISQWGHDFRPDYIRLKWALKELGQPQVIALTATATPEVRADIIEQLALGKFGRQEPQVFVTGFARHNLTLAVANVKGKAAKFQHIVDIVRQYKTGIIYCATRKNVEKVAAELPIKCIAYHGAMTPEQRNKAQTKFMNGDCDVAVATNAFGMGIDRSDLRFVIHFDIPGSVEAYYQEAGRAGRDGEPARCEILFNYADVRTQEFFIEGANPTREIIAALYQTLTRLCQRGPITMSIDDIAEQLPGVKNGMAVGSALFQLERAGFIARDYESGNRTYTTGLVEPVKAFSELEIDFERLESKRQRDLGKLHKIIAYADHHGCRHNFILDYFGDTEASPHCTVCDNCVTQTGKTAPRLPTDAETVSIQKTLSCVARVNGRFGRARIAQTLTGSRSKEVVDARLDQLSTYGLLAEQGSDYVWSLLDSLIRAGCIAVGGDRFPTLSITDLGREVMLKQKTIPLTMPAANVGAASAPRPARKKAAGTAATPPADYNNNVFEALKKWRRETSTRMGIPAYVVFPDKTLQELARLLPESPADLLNVRGIGPAKAQRFGEEALAVIAEAQSS